MRSSLVVGALVILAAALPAAGSRGGRRLPAGAKTIGSCGRLPLHFEANLGQAPEEVRFLARGRGYNLFLTPTESVLVLGAPAADRVREGNDSAAPKPASPAAILRMRLLDANPRPVVRGREEFPGKSHYFIGRDPGRWRTNIPHYARVEYEAVYAGVGLRYYGTQGELEYDFVVDPGADPGVIRIGIEGADRIAVDATGSLIMSLPGGEVVQRAPVVYQESDGARRAVEGRFVVRGGREVGFEVGSYDAGRQLVLDPVLIYSTYLGGDSADVGHRIVVDASGNAYLAGQTASIDFPTVNSLVGPLQPENGGSTDAFVSKLNAAGTALVYSTYLGGFDFDYAWGIAVDASGNAYVVGGARSADFPTVNALQPAKAGGSDAFVAKLSPAGSALVYSTYYGGSSDDFGHGVAVDVSGNAYVIGYTQSSDFPTASPVQATPGGAMDAFVGKLNAAGSALVYSTYLGGSADDFAYAIAVDTLGNAYLAGETHSLDFPTERPLQGENHGPPDACVTKLNETGSALVYSTYLGGSDIDSSYDIALDAAGNVTLAGRTQSTDFPTANPLQGANAGLLDAFVASVNPAGSALAYSTYLGGSFGDAGFGIALDRSGNVYLTGYTQSIDFPTRNAFQGSNAGLLDVIVVKLKPGGTGLVYSTYLGGGNQDVGYGIAVNALGSAYVTGSSTSTNFPTRNPLQPTNRGSVDAFVTRFGGPSTGSFAPAQQDDAEVVGSRRR